MAYVMCLYGPPGAGKTINSTRVPGKTLLLSSDNSALVLRNFDRPNLTIKNVESFKGFENTFIEVTKTKQYDTVAGAIGEAVRGLYRDANHSYDR